MYKVEQVIRDYGLKATMNGVVMGLGSILLFGQTDNINALGMRVPSYVPIGLAGGVSSIAGDVVHDYVLPHIPHNEKLMNLEAAGLNFLASGGAFTGALMLTTGIASSNIPKAVAYGGGVKVLGDAFYENYIVPLY